MKKNKELLRKIKKGFKKLSINKNSVADKKMFLSISLNNPQGQYSYGMCWASAVATVINTIRLSGIT